LIYRLFLTTFAIWKKHLLGKIFTNNDGDYDFPLFIAEIAVLIYASFYAYNKLIPQKKYTQFLSALTLIIIVIAFVDGWLDTTSVQIGELTGFLANVVLFPIFLLIAFGIKLSYHGARQLLVIDRFNTLNNIYAANLENQDKANDIILGLADLLRYQLESGNKQKALLVNEIESLENYIALEKIRVLDCEVKLEKQGNFDDVEIVPLLLLPFIENAFKYGTGIEPGSIDIRFEIDEKNYFSFYCGNKIVQKKGKIHSGGIGLDNVRKRLQLMYPNKHKLDINNENNYFKINLNVQL